MLGSRIIPTLLLKGVGLYKTKKFKDFAYIGDPINAVRIFNTKAVDEIILLDISSNRFERGPNFQLIRAIVEEAFIPVCYGGGITKLRQIADLIHLGVEKVAVNSAAVGSLDLISEASKVFGNQSIVVSIDVRRSLMGCPERFIKSGSVNTKKNPVEIARIAEEAGAGELLINSIDRDGTMVGYDIPLVRDICQAVRIPVIACGGAGSLNDMVQVIRDAGAASAAAGSFFVFHGKHRAVLLTYPSELELNRIET